MPKSIPKEVHLTTTRSELIKAMSKYQRGAPGITPESEADLLLDAIAGVRRRLNPEPKITRKL